MKEISSILDRPLTRRGLLQAAAVTALLPYGAAQASRKGDPQPYEAQEVFGFEEREAQVVAFQGVRLITPERANRLGIRAEFPVFVSSRINQPNGLFVCSDDPLVYQVGHITKSQNFRFNRRGIFYYTRSGDMPNFGSFFNSNFYAMITPLGERVEDSFFGISAGRCEDALTTEIKIFCREGLDCYCSPDALRSGVLTASGSAITPEIQFLKPICSTDRHPQYAGQEKYTFTVTEAGEVKLGLPEERADRNAVLGASPQKVFI